MILRAPSDSSIRRRWFQFSMWTVLGAPVVVAVLIVTECFGLVGFRYPSVVENQPLLSPCRVGRVNGSELLLEDGRVVTVQLDHLPLEPPNVSVADLVEESDNQVDLEPSDDRSHAVVYVKRHRSFCLRPWNRVVTVPLIRVEVPTHKRYRVGVAQITSTAGVAMTDHE